MTVGFYELVTLEVIDAEARCTVCLVRYHNGEGQAHEAGRMIAASSITSTSFLTISFYLGGSDEPHG